ncbi:MAG: preprotein translocase subunit SecY [Desulfurococcaceae archaeon]
MGILKAMAEVAKYVPSAPKPTRRVSLGERLVWTALALVIYLLMSHTPLYGVTPQAAPTQFLILQVVFAAHSGTLMELGIGPIVTAGLIMQILAGAKLINLDLSDPEGRKIFTGAQKTLALILAAIQAAMYVLACRYWSFAGNPITYCAAGWNIRVAVALQLFIASLFVMMLDEMIQKGWGLGSGVSLFILAGVATTIFWNIFSPLKIGNEYIGLVPHAISVVASNGDVSSIMVRPGGRDLVGLISTFTIAVILIYLSSIRVEIPITSPKLYTIKSKVPLQFLYVTNIPILFIGILYSNIIVFATLMRTYLSGIVPRNIVDMLVKYDENGHVVGGVAYYLSSPQGLLSAISDPMHLVIYSVLVIVLAVVFGLLWVEVAGLNPSTQAQQLIDSGFEVPGFRRNPKILEQVLAKYIYPLTILSSIIVALIAIVADVLGAYGSGTGLLLAIGILQQYYALIAYERTLEAYPLLRRLVGE